MREQQDRDIPGDVTGEATGVVLAGGQSRRMGQSKAALLIAGEPLLHRVVRRLRLTLGEVVVAGAADLADIVPDTRIVQDLPGREGQGPLAGLEAAFDAIETMYAFVVACDMPFVVPDLVQAMVALAVATPAAEALVLRTSEGSEGVEPLHSVYSRACLPDISRQLDRGERSLLRLLPHLRVAEAPAEMVSRYDPSGRSAFNANTPEDWQRALAMAAAAPEISL